MPRLMFGILLIILGTGGGGLMAWTGQNIVREAWESITKPIFKSSLVVLWTRGGMFYHSKNSNKISPVDVACFLEIVNNRSLTTMIKSYKARALLKYSEGDQIVEKWHVLRTMGFDEIYCAQNGNLSKVKRLDFSKTSFELKAYDKPLSPGEPLRGWILLETDTDLGDRPFDIINFEITLKNSSGKTITSQLMPLKNDKDKDNLDLAHFDVLGSYDFSDKKFIVAPLTKK
jgi:hypothetical protein